MNFIINNFWIKSLIFLFLFFSCIMIPQVWENYTFTIEHPLIYIIKINKCKDIEKKIETALKNGANVNDYYRSNSPLIYALKNYSNIFNNSRDKENKKLTVWFNVIKTLVKNGAVLELDKVPSLECLIQALDKKKILSKEKEFFKIVKWLICNDKNIKTNGSLIFKDLVIYESYFPIRKIIKMKILNLLLKCGVDINTKINGNISFLSLFILNNKSLDFIKYLIDKGIDVNLKDGKGKTALIHAIEKWRPIYSDIMKLLVNYEITEDIIKHGYEEEEINKFKNENKKKKYLEIQKIYDDRWSWQHERYITLISMLKENNIDISEIEKDKRKEVITKTYNSERDKIIKLLLDSGADINIKDNAGKTPLIFAIEKRYDFHFIKFLIDNGADVNISDNMGKTPLMFAIEKRYNLDCIKYLVEHGADVNAQETGKYKRTVGYYYLSENNFKTPLHYAVLYGNIEIVKYLLSNGADVNIVDEELLTPFIYSIISSRNYKLIKLLVENRMDINKKSYEGRTPLICTLINWGLDQDVLDFIIYKEYFEDLKNHHYSYNYVNSILDVKKREIYSSLNEPYFYQDNHQYKYYLSFLKDYKIDLDNIKMERRKKIIEKLYYSVKSKIVKLLLKHGADPTIKDNSGKTALDYARENGNPEIIKLLEEAMKKQGINIK